MPAPALGPDWSITGQLWVPDADSLDDRLADVVSTAFHNVGSTYALVRWQDNQADVAMIERWWARQRPLAKARALTHIGDAALAVTIGHSTSIAGDGVAWKVRTVKFNRTRAKLASAAS